MNTRITTSNRRSCYHCMSRTVHGEHWLGEREKAAFREMMWRVADFCGVRILTYCIMSNHFHLLVEVPEDGARALLDDAELLRRYRVLNKHRVRPKYGSLTPEEMAEALAQNDARAADLRERLKARMCDLSQFMEILKVRFTRWYNHQHETFGTFWSTRFKSVLIAGEADTLTSVANYIDLNPVRAGMVSDPADYMYSGFGDAANGGGVAREGLEYCYAYGGEPTRSSFSNYRALLYARGTVGLGVGKGGTIAAEVAKRVLGSRGQRPVEPYPDCFGDWLRRAFVLGSAEFVARYAGLIQRTLNRKKPPKLKPLGEVAFFNQGSGRAAD